MFSVNINKTENRINKESRKKISEKSSNRQAKRKVLVVSPYPNTSKDQFDTTMEMLLRKWQEANAIRLKGGTKIRYENIINTHIIPDLGNLKINEITKGTVNSFLNNKLQNGRLDGSGGLSPNYVRSISMIISSALNYAVEEGYPVTLKGKINKPSATKDEFAILSIENQRILEEKIKESPDPTNIGIMISLYTGLRIGEICALNWQDINLKERTIHVKHTVSRVKSNAENTKTQLILDEPKTPSSKRDVPIPSPLFAVLSNCYKDNPYYVVSNTDSFISPRTYEFRFHKVLSKCNIKQFNYHGLRHTFATRCIEAGVDIKSLSEILGHSSVSLTLNTYVHSSLEMKKIQLEKLTSHTA